MRAEIAKVVFPIIHRALETQKRLADGHHLSCDAELVAFKALLLTEREAAAIPEFGGEAQPDSACFLGGRYLLACWLDATFGQQPSWSERWPAHALESSLFGTRHGAAGFRQQAEFALVRPGSDARELCFLLVHLGGRSAWPGEPERAAAWVKDAKAKLISDLAAPWLAPPALDVTPQAPPLRQREKLHRALLAVCVPLTVIAPLAAWMFVRWIGW